MNRCAWLPLVSVFACQICSHAQTFGSSLADIKAAAEAGEAAAQDKLAEQFLMRTDTTQAEMWYRKAAEQGYAHAQGKLGDLLFNHARLTFGLKPDVKMAIGSEAVKWLALGANQGDTQSEGDLATGYLNGYFLKTDLVEAYKWGELASRGFPFDAGAIEGRSVRDMAILKMTTNQIAEANRRVAAFTVHSPAPSESPEPSWVTLIKLSGVSGPANQRLAIINNQTFSVGDSSVLKIEGQAVKVQSLEIRDKSVLVRIEGLDKPKELELSEN